MILGWSSFKVVQMVPVHCISRSQELKIDFLTKNLKNLLVRNRWMDFSIILQNVPLVILYQDCSSHLDSSKNMAARGQGLFSLIYLYRKLWKSSCQKPLDRFQYNSAEMFLWWSTTKIVQAIWIRPKNMATRGWSLFSLYICIENFKNFLVRNHWTDFNIILQKCSFWRSSTKIVQAIWIRPKNMATRGWSLFSIYIYIENFKNLLVRNHWTDFNIISQKCFFGDPQPRLFKLFGFIKKHGHQGAGLIFPVHLYRKQKPLDRFHYNLAEMFLWWPSTKIIQVMMIHQKTWLPGDGAYFPYILK